MIEFVQVYRGDCLFNKNMTEVIDHMEKLEELETTTKHLANKKNDKESSEDKTEKSKTEKFHKNNPKFKGTETKEECF